MNNYKATSFILQQTVASNGIHIVLIQELLIDSTKIVGLTVKGYNLLKTHPDIAYLLKWVLITFRYGCSVQMILL